MDEGKGVCSGVEGEERELDGIGLITCEGMVLSEVRRSRQQKLSGTRVNKIKL